MWLGRREGGKRGRRELHAGKGSARGWARARTSNMRSMFVTPEVFQLEMSASKSFRSWKSLLMSVMPETSQVSMVPYVTSAALGLALYSSAAVSRAALVVKTWLSATRRRLLVGGTGVLAARSTGSHCDEHATGRLASALLATLDLAMRGRKAAQKTAATPMRTSTRKLETNLFACRLRWEGHVKVKCAL